MLCKAATTQGGRSITTRECRVHALTAQSESHRSITFPNVHPSKYRLRAHRSVVVCGLNNSNGQTSGRYLTTAFNLVDWKNGL